MPKSKKKDESKAEVKVTTSRLTGYRVVIPPEFAMGKDPETGKKAISMGIGFSTIYYPVGESVFMSIEHFNHLASCGAPFMAAAEITPLYEGVVETVVEPEVEVKEETPIAPEPQAVEPELPPSGANPTYSPEEPGELEPVDKAEDGVHAE